MSTQEPSDAEVEALIVRLTVDGVPECGYREFPASPIFQDAAAALRSLLAARRTSDSAREQDSGREGGDTGRKDSRAPAAIQGEAVPAPALAPNPLAARKSESAIDGLVPINPEGDRILRLAQLGQKTLERLGRIVNDRGSREERFSTCCGHIIDDAERLGLLGSGRAEGGGPWLRSKCRIAASAQAAQDRSANATEKGDDRG